MDDLLREFLTETSERLDVVDVELVRLERNPDNAYVLANIFRLLHTIKGTCGFLGLPRLEALTHAAEALMDRFRNGLPVTAAAVTLMLATIDRIKYLLVELERRHKEPAGHDLDLTDELDRMAQMGRCAEVPGGAQPRAVADAAAIHARIAATGGSVRRRCATPEEPQRAFGETAIDEVGSATPSPLSTPSPASDLGSPPAAVSDSTADADDVRTLNLTSQSIRVAVGTLENLMTLVSELVLTRNQLIETLRHHGNSDVKASLQRLSNVTAKLLNGVTKIRMQPVGNAWQKLPRLVRNLARQLGKEIELEIRGAEIELDRKVLEAIKEPIAHMVRNSADHGLEPPHERREHGKPEKGTILLSAHHEGGQIVIAIVDDGRGLDTAKIKAQAIARGLASEAELAKLSEAEIHKFIFAPGFSTAGGVTSISGRGVGMDVVRNNIEVIGGTVLVESRPGKGAGIVIKVPHTLAIPLMTRWRHEAALAVQFG
jgi:two-component system chemotaxis sensor kinase CheA